MVNSLENIYMQCRDPNPQPPVSFETRPGYFWSCSFRPLSIIKWQQKQAQSQFINNNNNIIYYYLKKKIRETTAVLSTYFQHHPYSGVYQVTSNRDTDRNVLWQVSIICRKDCSAWSRGTQTIVFVVLRRGKGGWSSWLVLVVSLNRLKTEN